MLAGGEETQMGRDAGEGACPRSVLRVTGVTCHAHFSGRWPHAVCLTPQQRPSDGTCEELLELIKYRVVLSTECLWWSGTFEI